MKITAIGILRSTADSLAAGVGESDPHTVAARKAHNELAELIVCVDDMFAERAARGAKDVGTLVELRKALASVKGGAA